MSFDQFQHIRKTRVLPTNKPAAPGLTAGLLCFVAKSRANYHLPLSYRAAPYATVYSYSHLALPP